MTRTNPDDGGAQASWKAIASIVGLSLIQRAVWWFAVGTVGATNWAQQLMRWDAGWYRDIAATGYNLGTDGKRSNLAFFPAYPLLSRWVTQLIPGHSIIGGLLTVNTLASVAAVWGVIRFGEALRSPRVGYILALAWLVTPRSYILMMPYSEALFAAFVIWSLVFLARGRWWQAALFCALAGFTRPTGAAILAVVGGWMLWLLARRLWALARERDGGTTMFTRFPAPVPSMLTSIGAGLLAASGFTAGLVHVAWMWGSWDGYFQVQESWNNGMGNPWKTVQLFQRYFKYLLAGDSQPSFNVALVMVPFWTVMMGLLLVMSWKRPRWLPATATTLVLWLMMASAQEYYGSRERYLLPAVPLLLPLAMWIERRWARGESRAHEVGSSVLGRTWPFGALWVLLAILSGTLGCYLATHHSVAP